MNANDKLNWIDYCVLFLAGIFLPLVIIVGIKLLFLTTYHYIPSSYAFYPSLKVALIATLICLPIFVRLTQLIFYKTALLVITTLAISFAVVMLIVSLGAFNYINQYNPKAPIELIEAKVIDKKTYIRHTVRKGTFHHVYFDLWTTFLGALPTTLDMQREDIYPLVEVGDVVTIKVQKGNLGYYFFTQLIVEKNNQVVDL